MRRLVVLLLVPILLTLALAKAAVGDSTPGGSAAANGSAVEPVTICGTLFCVGGKTFYPYGASFYSSTQGAGILSNPAGAIALAQQQHLTTLRVVNWLSHNATVAAATSEATWRPVDTFIADAEQAGLRVWLDLSDFKTVLMHQCLNPYTDLSDWYNLVDYAAHRVNTVNRATYGSDPEIAWIGFLGEPREADKYYSRLGAGNSSGNIEANASPEPNWGVSGGECNSPLYYSADNLSDYYASVESRWKSEASLPTMAGGLTKLDEPNSGNINWKSILGNPYNDICGFKTYGRMESWLPTGTSYCAQILHKPSVNVEWGYQQSVGDAARAVDFNRQFANNNAAGIAANFYWNAGYQSGGYDVDNGTLSPQTFQQIAAHAPQPPAAGCPTTATDDDGADVN
jgi:hypothetical protein